MQNVCYIMKHSGSSDMNDMDELPMAKLLF